MDQTQFHFDPLERVMVPAKRFPVDAVGVGSVRTIQIKSVRIGPMARIVPPPSFVRSGAGASIRILVFVFGAEASSRRRHGRTCGSKDKATIKIYRGSFDETSSSYTWHLVSLWTNSNCPETPLGQSPSKYIGPKIWPDIRDNLKSFPPYSFGKQFKNVRQSCKIPVDFSFICLSLFRNIVLMFLYSLISSTSTVAQPIPQHIGMISSHGFLLFCLLVLSDVDSMRFLTFLSLLVKSLNKNNLCWQRGWLRISPTWSFANPLWFKHAGTQSSIC